MLQWFLRFYEFIESSALFRENSIGPYGSVYMEICGNSNGKPWGPIQSILSVTVAAVSVNEP